MTATTSTEQDAMPALGQEEYSRIGAAIALTQTAAVVSAILEVPDAELGHQLKSAIADFRENATLFLEPSDAERQPAQSSVGTGHQARSQRDAILQRLEHEAAPARRQLVEEGQILPAVSMSKLLGLSKQGLDKALASRRIFTVDVAEKQYFPAFFASPDLDRRKLEKVAQLLGDLPSWSKFHFFTSRNSSLNGVTPLQALKRGLFREVKDAAAGFAER